MEDKKIVMPTADQYPPYYEYVMPKAMAEFYLAERSGDNKKMRPHDYLVKVVNEQFNIRGTCITVSTD